MNKKQDVKKALGLKPIKASTGIFLIASILHISGNLIFSKYPTYNEQTLSRTVYFVFSLIFLALFILEILLIKNQSSRFWVMVNLFFAVVIFLMLIINVSTIISMGFLS